MICIHVRKKNTIARFRLCYTSQPSSSSSVSAAVRNAGRRAAMANASCAWSRENTLSQIFNMDTRKTRDFGSKKTHTPRTYQTCYCSEWPADLLVHVSGSYKMSIGLVSTAAPVFCDWFHPLFVDKV